MCPEPARPLADCAGYSDRRNDNLTGPTRFKTAAIAADESFRRLVVSAGSKIMPPRLFQDLQWNRRLKWPRLFTRF